jgi:O-antigen ligase
MISMEPNHWPIVTREGALALPRPRAFTLDPSTLGGEAFWETTAAVLTILFFSGINAAIADTQQGYNADPIKYDGVAFALQLCVYLLVLPFLFRYRSTLIGFAREQKLVWLLVGLAALSSMWSPVPGSTFKHGLLLAFTTAWGLYFGTRYSVEQQLRLLAWSFGIAVVLSFIAAILLPGYGTMGWEHFGAWRGVYPHRNALARMMVLSTLVFVLQARMKDKSKFLCWLAALGSVLLVLLSDSKTGLVILFFFAILFGLSPLLRWKRSRLVLSLSMLASLAVCLLLWLPWLKILQMLGRDITLSGRVSLWILVIMKALQHPWLGYGYTGFWLGLGGESASVWVAMHWLVPNAHNGFLDLWLSLGLAGLALFLAGFAIVFWKSLKKARLGNSAELRWPMLYLIFLVVYNLDETNLFQHNSLMWALYVAVAGSLIARSHFACALLPSKQSPGCAK